MLLQKKGGNATNWLIGVVMLAAILTMASDAFGGELVWGILWKSVAVVVLLSLIAFAYCFRKEHRLSLHQRYG